MLYSNRNLNFNVEMIILLVNRNQLLLYAVTDSRWLGNKTLAQAVEEAIKGGVTFVQIREKEASYDEFKKIALDVKKVTDKYNVPMIINDNVELAKDIDADGVHVGGDDMSVANARKILGDNKIIGATARNYERAVTAVGIGAMFDTSTKSGTTHMTKELSNKITSYANIPVVGIGGINSENIMSLEGYGIDGVAVVSAIFKSEEIEKSAKIMKEKASKIVRES
mgnify:CR=1 FL=1